MTINFRHIIKKPSPRDKIKSHTKCCQCRKIMLHQIRDLYLKLSESTAGNSFFLQEHKHNNGTKATAGYNFSFSSHFSLSTEVKAAAFDVNKYNY